MHTLFDHIKRDFNGSSNHNENSYDYYNRSARKDITIIRDLLEKWFSSYPENEKFELKKRFQKDFDPAFYELFLYSLFKKLNFEVVIHPDLPSTDKKPDFLIKRDELEVYIEAKVVNDKSANQQAFERKINELYDHLDKIICPGFLLQIDTLNVKTAKQPSAKKIIDHIQTEISKFHPDKITEEITKYGFETIPEIEYENDDIHIIVKPMPVIESAREIEDKRAIGMFPFETFWGGSADALKSSINNKAKRYGKLDKPFIVCMNMLASKGSMDWDSKTAVWGSQSISWSSNPEDRDIKPSYALDGVFLTSKGPRLKNLSGVFVSRVFPSNIPNAEHSFFEHPFTENKFDFSKIELSAQFAKDGKIQTRKGKSLTEIFRIPENWLE